MQTKPIPKLMQLLRDNKPRNIPLTVTGENNADDEATIYLYDVIDAYWGISAQDFAQALSGISAKTINLRVNSPGGDVFEARAMVSAINAAGAKVVAHIDGIAASSASWVALACDEVRITQGAMLMVHNSWTYAMGDAGELRSTAALMDKIDVAIGADYTKKCGKSADEVKAWMDAETWFSADEAKAAGLVDSVIEGKTEPADKWNLAAYANAPKNLPKSGAPELTEEEQLLMDNRSRHLRLLESSST